MIATTLQLLLVTGLHIAGGSQVVPHGIAARGSLLVSATESLEAVKATLAGIEIGEEVEDTSEKNPKKRKVCTTQRVLDYSIHVGAPRTSMAAELGWWKSLAAHPLRGPPSV